MASAALVHKQHRAQSIQRKPHQTPNRPFARFGGQPSSAESSEDFPAPSFSGVGGERVMPKLEVGDVNDPLEREADDIADQVMRSPAPTIGRETTAAPGADSLGGPVIRRACASCEAEDDELRREPAAGQRGGRASDAFASQVRAQANLGGSPLPATARNFLEPRLGVGLDGVRVHADGSAGQLARQVDARAFTLGQDIFFAPGELRPQTNSGMRLLAHEVAHTMQGHGPLGSGAARRSVGGSSEADGILRRSCPKKRDPGERENSKNDITYAGSQLWGVEGLNYQWPVAQGSDGPKIENISEHFKVWRVQGFAVDSAELNGSPVAVFLLQRILARQKEVIFLGGTDAGVRTGVRRAAVMFGRTDCMGKEEHNQNLQQRRKTRVERLAKNGGLNVINDIGSFIYNGGLSHGVFQAEAIASASHTLPKYPAYLGRNTSADDRKTNRSVLIVEVPVPATSAEDEADLERQHTEKKIARLRDWFDWIMDNLCESSDAHVNCILEKAKPYLIERILKYVDSKGTQSPPDNDDDAFLGGTGDASRCDNEKAAGDFCMWFGRMMKAYDEDCGGKDYKWRKGRKWGDCKAKWPKIKPRYVSKEIFNILLKEDAAPVSTFLPKAHAVAKEVIHGVDDYYTLRMDKADGNILEAPYAREMLRWFIGRQFHVGDGEILFDSPNRSNIYSCFDAKNLFNPDRSAFMSDYGGDSPNGPY